jgi:hypothetical protein
MPFKLDPNVKIDAFDVKPIQIMFPDIPEDEPINKTIKKFVEYIATFSLFEFNDLFQRHWFIHTVGALLSYCETKGKIMAWKIVCDETNNTPEIIGKGEFVGDIFFLGRENDDWKAGRTQINVRTEMTGVSINEICSTI